MPRVKRGTNRRDSRKKTLDRASGYFLTKSKLHRAAQEAVERARREGIQASLFDVRYVKPLDREAILDLCRRCGGLVTVEENALAGGVGSSVLELLADEGVRVPSVRRLGVPDRFVEHGTQGELRTEIGLDGEAVFRAIRELAAAEPGV